MRGAGPPAVHAGAASVGDEVIGIFIQALTAGNDARQAIDAGLALRESERVESSALFGTLVQP